MQQVLVAAPRGLEQRVGLLVADWDEAGISQGGGTGVKDWDHASSEGLEVRQSASSLLKLLRTEYSFSHLSKAEAKACSAAQSTLYCSADLLYCGAVHA